MLGARVSIRVEGANLSGFMQGLRENGVICADQRCREGAFSAALPAGHLKKARLLAQEHKVQLTVTERRGLRFSFYRIKFRYGVALGVLGILLVIFWVSNLIVKVEVTGNAAVPEAQIRRVLEEIGIDQGAWIPGIDFRMCETKLRLAIPELRWAGIRHTGGRVVVDVAEATPQPGMLHDRVPCNYVATRDACIQSIMPACGMVLRQVGDGVKAGDVLISGVLEEETGAVSYFHASGSVTGVYQETMTFAQPLAEELRIPEEPVRRRVLSLFGQRIPLYFGEVQPSMYEYAESETRFSMLGREIPMGILHCTYIPYGYRICAYERQEAEALLREKCTQYEQNFHSSDEIQDKTLEFRQEDSVIYCDVRYVICGEIGTIREIFIK